MIESAAEKLGLRIDWPDIHFSAKVARVGGGTVDFEIYELFDSDPPLSWQRQGSLTHPDPVGSLEEAEVYAHGTVRFDGCSNWSLPEAYVHFCSREELLNLGVVLARCWEWARDHLPTWAG
jgi:hypothetical protein